MNLVHELLSVLNSFIKKKKADERTRTVNLLITNQLLCQLSHIGLLDIILPNPALSQPDPTTMCFLSEMGPTGLEPVTLCL